MLDSKDRDYVIRFITILTCNKVSLITKSVWFTEESCKVMTGFPYINSMVSIPRSSPGEFSKPGLGVVNPLCLWWVVPHSLTSFMEGFWLLVWRVWMSSKYGSWQPFRLLTYLPSPEGGGPAELVSRGAGSTALESMALGVRTVGLGRVSWCPLSSLCSPFRFSLFWK